MIEHHESEIQDLNSKIDAVRKTIFDIDKEINASGASLANYRDNIRVRKLAKEIQSTQTEIDSYDMEEAAIARRNFEEKYPIFKEKENNLHTAVNDFSRSYGYGSNNITVFFNWRKTL